MSTKIRAGATVAHNDSTDTAIVWDVRADGTLILERPNGNRFQSHTKFWHPTTHADADDVIALYTTKAVMG